MDSRSNRGSLSIVNSDQKELGDFQTPLSLAHQVTEVAWRYCSKAAHIVEPTCGIGNFLEATYKRWQDNAHYYGFEINGSYIKTLHHRFASKKNIKIIQSNLFIQDWDSLFKGLAQTGKQILVIGNLPWVTNATLGAIGSKNLPVKENLHGYKGLNAKMGKSNFDLAEWMLIKLIEVLKGKNAVMALLVKHKAALRAMQYYWQNHQQTCRISLYNIDAKTFFNVHVAACLLIIDFSAIETAKEGKQYDSLYSQNYTSRIGMFGEKLIADLDQYSKIQILDGHFEYSWRSGIKHDACRIMELTITENGLINGFNNRINIEDTLLYPLLKSSDLAKNQLAPRKKVIITQQKIGSDTAPIKRIAPLTWKYLCSYKSKLDQRKSSIYQNKPSFSIFGIGPYSFSAWKVAISSMYKNFNFVAVPPTDNKPIMLDDTCYFFPCHCEEEARFWTEVLNSSYCYSFIKALTFMDSKRPITIEVLGNISLMNLAALLGLEQKARRFIKIRP